MSNAFLDAAKKDMDKIIKEAIEKGEVEFINVDGERVLVKIEKEKELKSEN